MVSRARTLGLLAALVTASLGLPTPARGEGSADQATSGFRLVADARWGRTLTVRYRPGEPPTPSAETGAPTFRSGSREAAGSPATPLPSALPEQVRAPSERIGEYLQMEVPVTARPGRADSWLEVVAPAERDIGLFLAAQSAVLVDMAQTLEISGSTGYEETNRLLGERPSDGAVVAYFGSIAALHAATYVMLDGRWANVLSRAILFVQVPAIDNNARLGVRISF